MLLLSEYFAGYFVLKKPVYENGGKSQHMCNWWELEKEWIISSVWVFFSLHPASAFLDFFLTGVATLVILCGSVSWLWQQLALLSSRNYCPPHRDCVPTVACVLTFSLARRGTSQAFPAGRGGEKEVRERNRLEGQWDAGRWKIQQTGK